MSFLLLAREMLQQSSVAALAIMPRVGDAGSFPIVGEGEDEATEIGHAAPPFLCLLLASSTLDG
jgi:hypothetical protein